MKRFKMQSVGAALLFLLQITYIQGKTCTKEVVNQLAQNAKNTCSQVEVVDKYISHVLAKENLPVPSFTDRHGFKAILSQYNGDLKTSKDHTKPWRTGDNVVASLKVVVIAAQGFEPKFKAELVKNQARIKNLLENHEDIATMEAAIAALQKDIADAKEAMKGTDVAQVISHLESVIKNKEREINTTMTEHNIAQGRRELAELVKYLEFVKAGAEDTETKAIAANTKISSFRENIIKDAGAFKRHRGNAQAGIKKLQEEKTNNNNAIKSNQNSINSARAKITQENNQIASLNTQIANAQREIREIEDRINRNLRKVRKKKKFGRWFRWVPVAGWTIGNKFYKDAKRREEELAREKRNFVNNGNRQIQSLRANINNRNAEIQRHQNQINSLTAKNSELEKELQQFNQLDGHLNSLETETNAILPPIANAVSGVGKIKSTFDDVRQSLTNAIKQALEAKTEAEIKNMNYFIYNQIDDLKCKWDSAKDKIVLVGKCV